MNDRTFNRLARLPYPGPGVQAREAAEASSIGLDDSGSMIDLLNPVLADLITLRDLYTQHHRQISGPTTLQRHRLFDEHLSQLNELIDQVEERLRILGGIDAVSDVDAASLTRAPRPSRGQESTSQEISRLLEAQEIVLRSMRTAALFAEEHDDSSTHDLLVRGVLRANEMQAWYLAEHQSHGPSTGWTSDLTPVLQPTQS
jgi:starvation-inducible DNA-binding protein